MSVILDANPQVMELIHQDLCRGVNPNQGRRGMTAEQVLRAVVIKQQNGFTYRELAFLLNDCLSFRRFCHLPPNQTVSASALQRAIKKLSMGLSSAAQVPCRYRGNHLVLEALLRPLSLHVAR
ncbi:MAG: transposase, partial [bacterium]|nr:transposase [bacterium]